MENVWKGLAVIWKLYGAKIFKILEIFAVRIRYGIKTAHEPGYGQSMASQVPYIFHTNWQINKVSNHMGSIWKLRPIQFPYNLKT